MLSFSNLRRASLIALVFIPTLVLTPAHAKDEGWGPGHAMMWGGPTRNWFGWGESEHFCGGTGTKNIERFTALVERQLKVTETQKPALDTLKNAFQTALAELQPLCEKPHTGRWSPLERLTVAEAHMNSMITAIRTVRGPLESFYNLLDDKQKQTLDEIHPDWRSRLPWNK
ncbi:MAG: Spy/CpxP family protein refolding chaperone [Hyphomicrobiales bacterium]|jgi:hypothetical protein|nr:Spy/CpxP family protein refolding chaperone [Hyphomicrobiales bacterium]